MVFRFTEENDKELMREVLRLKPFSAPRGTTATVWDEVATSLSAAVGVCLNAKQIRDRLKLLKKACNEAESEARVASGVEQSLNAVNEQSHYTERDGYILDYIALEDAHKRSTQTAKDKRLRKEEELSRCADEIVEESNRRRASRLSVCSEDDVEAQSDEASSGSNGIAAAPPLKTAKREYAFVQEVKRQDKRQKQNREQELDQAQKQFNKRLEFDKKLAEDRLQFEERVQIRNHTLILECAKLLGAALSKNKQRDD